MYFVGDTLHFSLYELLGVAAICNIFDKDVSKRILNVFHYHKDSLKECIRQPLQFSGDDIERFHLQKLTEVHSKWIQPEFIFSDDEDIF